MTARAKLNFSSEPRVQAVNWRFWTKVDFEKEFKVGTLSNSSLEFSFANWLVLQNVVLAHFEDEEQESEGIGACTVQ
jgi:hypothetical protein